MVRNLDHECYLNAVREQREHQEDWLAVGYAPKGFYLKDFCLIEAKGELYLFHIAGTPGVSCCLPGNEIWFGHATTRDMQHWETHEPCFYIDPAGWDNGHVFAPYVLEKDGTYWMFYTGCKLDCTQRIGVATSDDLFRWSRATEAPVIRPEEYDWAFCPTEGGSACRDPHVIQFDDEYWMYYTAVTKEGRGCVARALSKNLLDWEDQGPAFTFNGLKHCESSNVQRMDDDYLLFFGGHHEYWSYVVSDTPARWADQSPRPLWKGITAMEVIRRNGKRWLVAYFHIDEEPLWSGFRMFVGTVDWSDVPPKIHQLSTADELEGFGL